MENWGLITFSKRVLLTEKGEGSLFIRNARTVAHEVSHMWFGNLVTMEWWDDLWLNEGFARYAEHHILNELRPSFKVWESYFTEVMQGAFSADKVLERTHPVRVEVPDPDHLQSIFDTISYAKGSSICRMLVAFVGPEAFKEGLKLYMKRHRYGNTTTFDLLSALEEASQKPVTRTFKPWLEQPCFPLLSVERVSAT